MDSRQLGDFQSVVSDFDGTPLIAHWEWRIWSGGQVAFDCISKAICLPIIGLH
jgi:hypothetical protein